MKTMTRTTQEFRERPKARRRVVQTERFLVYYDGSLASNAALRAAVEKAAPKTEIVAVYCIVIPAKQQPSREKWQELEMRAQAYLAAAITNAYLRGRAIETKIVRCETLGEGLVEYAEQWCADLVFLGVEQGTGNGELNAVAEEIRRFTPAEVMVVRE